MFMLHLYSQEQQLPHGWKRVWSFHSMFFDSKEISCIFLFEKDKYSKTPYFVFVEGKQEGKSSSNGE